ncbi:HAUS1 protein, partial [Catharus fuscescens]|nr:HAUS1 protein [Catharus fuscescens]
QVTSWLKKIYGDTIPRYDVYERTVDILHEVMEYNEERDKDVTLLIEDMKDQAAKYEEEAEYWQDIMEESLGLFEVILPQEVITDLTDLVEGGMELEVDDTSLTSFYCAITYTTSELHKTKSKNDKMERELKTLMKKLTSALMLEKQLKEDTEKSKEYQEARKARVEIQSENLEFLKIKSGSLKVRIKKAENKLIDMGMDRSLTHEALRKSSQELAALQKKLDKLKSEVKSYQDLP